MIFDRRLDLHDADVILDGCARQATVLDVSPVVCVSDGFGYPIALRRFDRAKVTSITIAMNKAFTAAAHKVATHRYLETQPPDICLILSTQHNGRFSVLPGGLPIYVDGEVVGSVGVSGGTSDQDISVAKAGADAFAQALADVNVVSDGFPAEFHPDLSTPEHETRAET